jgi:hypothetical protein
MALIVVPTESNSGRMRRVGSVFLDPEICKGRNVIEDRNEFQTNYCFGLRTQFNTRYCAF